jgi:hypothetical protein
MAILTMGDWQMGMAENGGCSLGAQNADMTQAIGKYSEELI